MSLRQQSATLLAPVVLIVGAALIGSLFARPTEIYFINAFVATTVVVALYIFVGNSGVVSFGHISFVAVGAWAAGVLSVPVAEKAAIYTNLFPFLAETTVGNVPSLVVAALVGGTYAFVVGVPLMRLSGLVAGIATFAVLGITHNVLRYYEKIGPGTNTFASVPETTDLVQAALGAVIAVLVAVRVPGQPIRPAAPRDTRGCSCGPSGRHLDRPPPAVGVHPVGRSRRACRGPLRAPAAADDGGGLPRPDVHHARDARDRRRNEPLGRGGGRSRSAASTRSSRRRNPVSGGSICRAARASWSWGSSAALVLVLRPSGLTGGREFSLGRSLRTEGG